MSTSLGNSPEHQDRGIGNSSKQNIQWKTGKQNNFLANQNYGKNRSRFRTIKNLKKNRSSYESAKAEYERIRQEKKVAKEKHLQRKKDIETALNAYKERKKLKNQKLSAKTSKGQPIMKNRIELLLDQIQKTVK